MADGTVSHDGLSKNRLKAGAGGKASIGMKAKGTLLPLPSLTTWPTPLPVQIQVADLLGGDVLRKRREARCRRCLHR